MIDQLDLYKADIMQLRNTMKEHDAPYDDPQQQNAYMNAIIVSIIGISVVHYQLNYKESGCKDSEIILQTRGFEIN